MNKIYDDFFEKTLLVRYFVRPSLCTLNHTHANDLN